MRLFLLMFDSLHHIYPDLGRLTLPVNLGGCGVCTGDGLCVPHPKGNTCRASSDRIIVGNPGRQLAAPVGKAFRRPFHHPEGGAW